MNFISIPAYSRQKNVSAEYIRRLIKKGKITGTALQKNGKRYLINQELADKDIDNNLSYINKKKSEPKPKKNRNNPSKRNSKSEPKKAKKSLKSEIDMIKSIEQFLLMI